MKSIHDIGISAKVLIATSIVSIILITIASSLMLSLVSGISKEAKDTRINEMKYLLDEAITQKKNVGLTNAISVANDVRLSEALDEKDREKALKIVTDVSDKFKSSTGYKNIKIHIHDKDTHSFVRAWNPDKFGDDLSTFRKTLVKIKSEKKAFVAFETGRVGLVLRGLSPLVKDGKYYGSIEFIQGVNSVAKDFEKKKKHFILLMNEDLTFIATRADSSRKIGTYIVSQKFVNQDFYDEAKGIDFNVLLNDGSYQDKKYLYTFERVLDFEGNTLGLFLLGEDVSNVYNAVDSSTTLVYDSTFAMVLLIVILSIVIFIIINKLVLVEIKELEHTIEYVVENKDLTQSVTVNSMDEIGKIKNEFNVLMDYMNEVISESKNASNENASVSRELTQSSDAIVYKVNETTTIVNTTVDKNRALKVVLDESIINSKNTEENILVAQEKMHDAKDEIYNLSESVMQSNEVQLELSQKLDDLSREADQVKDVLTIISDIADQTNLLALNAAIEAARAGEHGRGFAVVADEVRKLAERTQKTLSEINITVNSIVQAISDSSNQIVSNTKEFEKLVDISELVANKIEDSSVIMDETTLTVQNSSSVAHNIETTIEQFMKDMDDIKSLMDSNIASSEDITTASHHLFTLTDSLKTMLNKYQTK